MDENEDTIEHRAYSATLLNIVYRSLRDIDCVSPCYMMITVNLLLRCRENYSLC